VENSALTEDVIRALGYVGELLLRLGVRDVFAGEDGEEQLLGQSGVEMALQRHREAAVCHVAAAGGDGLRVVVDELPVSGRGERREQQPGDEDVPAQPRVGEAGAAVGPAAARRECAGGAGDGRRGVRGVACVAGVEETRRRRGGPGQLQRLLRDLAEAGAAGASGEPRRVHRGGRHQRQVPAGEPVRGGAVHPRHAPGRPGRRALRNAEPAVVHPQQRRGAGEHLRGVQGRGPATGHRVGFVELRLRVEHQGTLRTAFLLCVARRLDRERALKKS
jgi:hypothetical protein